MFSVLLTSQLSNALLSWNNSIELSGDSSSYVSVPHNAALSITGSFTIEMWVNPDNVSSSQILLQKRTTTATGYTLYLSSGRVAIRTGSVTRLLGKTTISDSVWTHVAGTYEASTNVFIIYINGVFDTSSVVMNAAPLANNDSLYIGKGSNQPFNGKIDEVRVWSESQTLEEIARNRRLSLGTNTGIYKNLQLSLTFQNNDASPAHSFNDWSGNNLTGHSHSLTILNQGGLPSEYLSLNECVSFDGTGYVSGPSTSMVSPSSGITLEAWVYPTEFNADPAQRSVIIHKGNAAGTVMDYNLSIQRRSFQLMINETAVFGLTTSGEFFPLRQWTHISISYSGASGFMKVFLNGKLRWDDTNFVGNVHVNTDSIYIGGTSVLNKFKGLLDEVRIIGSSLPASEMSDNIFASQNEESSPGRTDAIYNFDGGLFANTDNSPRLHFRGTTSFSHNAYLANVSVSPLSFNTLTPVIKGFYVSSNSMRIPDTGTSGFMKSDTLNVPLNVSISDVNVFVALNHTDEDNLVLSLIAPDGTVVTLYSTASLISPSENIVTIFDQSAVPDLVSNKYVQFAPRIKPANNLNSAFSGKNTLGKWVLRIQDVAANDTGRLYGWGIQFNNMTSRPKILSLGSLIQGFYDPTANLLISDTVKVYLRHKQPPYNLLDSSKGILDSSGNTKITFNNVDDITPLFIIVKHRNSIETWSRAFGTVFELFNGTIFSEQTSSLIYDFKFASSRAFGSNQIQVDSGPNQFAVYSGDVTQDGSVNLSDITLIFNNSSVFASGYLQTDITGDNVTNLTDLVMTFNNAAGFVSKVTP